MRAGDRGPSFGATLERPLLYGIPSVLSLAPPALCGGHTFLEFPLKSEGRTKAELHAPSCGANLRKYTRL